MGKSGREGALQGCVLGARSDKNRSVDADYRIHVSEQLLAMNDRPMLEQRIKAMRGKTILMPDRSINRPDRALLAARFELYQAAN